MKMAFNIFKTGAFTVQIHREGKRMKMSANVLESCDHHMTAYTLFSGFINSQIILIAKLVELVTKWPKVMH